MDDATKEIENLNFSNVKMEEKLAKLQGKEFVNNMY